MKTLPTAAAIAMALSVGGAAAQEPPVNPDLDHDGRVTLAEFRQVEAERQGRMFARLDTNRDGRLTPPEFKAAAQQSAAQSGKAMPPAGLWMGLLMHALDRNGDGGVTRDEMAALTDQGFQRADTNHDGWLSADELAKARRRQGGGFGGGGK